MRKCTFKHVPSDKFLIGNDFIYKWQKKLGICVYSGIKGNQEFLNLKEIYIGLHHFNYRQKIHPFKSVCVKKRVWKITGVTNKASQM